MELKEKQGKSLAYISAEPDGYDPNRKYPMIILLHGFGANMNDLAGFSSYIDSKGYVYIFPNAPLTVDLGYGMIGSAWMPRGSSRTTDDTQKADELLSVLFDEVMSEYDVEAGNVILGGFSQGGMMTYRSGLTRPELFKGLVALSARIQDPDYLKTRLPEGRTQPVFVSHGIEDAMLSIEDGRNARDFLQAEGYDVSYNEYQMGHNISMDVINDLVPWIHNLLPPSPDAR